jgi:transcriptional regulator with XRE-family HTH domain
MQTLGERLRELRERNRFSLRSLAARVRITAPYLSDIELDRRHPSDRVLADLARALRASVDDLRQHDPKSLLSDIQRRIDDDANYGIALRRLLSRCRTAEELMRMADLAPR